MNGLRRALLALIAAAALGTAPVALAGGKDGGNNDNGNDGDKVTICHATGSATNPFVEITISVNAVAAHERHQDGEDIIPAPAGGCPDKKKDNGKNNDNGKKNHNGKKNDH